MPAKQAIDDKLQGNVATYLRCGGVVNNQLKKGLLLRLSVIFFKSVNIWQSYKHERDCLMHFLCQARRARCGGILNIRLTTNLPRNLLVKNILNRFRFDRIMVMSLWPHLFGPPSTLH